MATAQPQVDNELLGAIDRLSERVDALIAARLAALRSRQRVLEPQWHDQNPGDLVDVTPVDLDALLAEDLEVRV
jgi:hypothetical protein